MARPHRVEVDPFNGKRTVLTPGKERAIEDFATYLSKSEGGKTDAPNPLATEFTPNRRRAILHGRDSIGGRRIA